MAYHGKMLAFQLDIITGVDIYDGSYILELCSAARPVRNHS